MRTPDRWLDRFARRHPRFGIPRLMLYVIIGTLLVYVLDRFSSGTFTAVIDFSRAAIFHGQVWRLITFIFVPQTGWLLFIPPNIFTLAISLYFNYLIGSALEREWGTAKFTLFYLTGILLNILAGLLLGTTSMSYVNLSLFFAFATLYPNAQFYLFFFLPVKAKWLAWLDAALFLWAEIQLGVMGLFPLMPIPLIAVLNYFLFFWSDITAFLRRNIARARHQNSRKTVDFKAAARKAQETKGYMHKCAVCGVTDADDPNMEFRYCSKCDGYHCYCMEHINSHVHVKED